MSFQNPGAPITPPITTRVTPQGNAQKRVGGSYKRGGGRKAGPTGKRGSIPRGR